MKLAFLVKFFSILKKMIPLSFHNKLPSSRTKILYPRAMKCSCAVSWKPTTIHSWVSYSLPSDVWCLGSAIFLTMKCQRKLSAKVRNWVWKAFIWKLENSITESVNILWTPTFFCGCSTLDLMLLRDTLSMLLVGCNNIANECNRTGFH